MTDDAKRLVEALRERAEWAHANEWESPITLGDDLEAAAGMIEKLSEELESDERQYGRDAFAVLADEGAKLEADRDAWKRRCKAAERDLGSMVPCVSCNERPMAEAPACDKCEVNHENRHVSGYVWRGPCEENGGVGDDAGKSI